MRQIFAKLRRVRSDFGLVTGLLYIMDRGFNELSRGTARIHKYLLFLQPVAEEPGLPSHRGRNIQIRRVTRDGQNTPGLPLSESVIKARLQNEACCFVAYINDDFAGFIWVQTSAHREVEVRCEFVPTADEGVAWDYDIYIDPRYRASMVFAKLWDATNAYLKAAGMRWSASYISAFNPESIRAHQRLGAELCGSATFIRLGSVQLTLATLPPYAHLSIRRSRFTRIQIRAPSDR